MDRVVAILVALPPEESGDLVLLRTRVIAVQFGQHSLRIGDIAVVLDAGVPADRLGRFALLPLVRRILVPGIDHAVLFEALGARRQQIPAETSIADATLEDEHRSVGDLPHLMPDADLGADVTVGDGHPLVVEGLHVASAAPHDPRIANILAHGPVARVVDKVGVLALLLDRVRQGTRLVGGADLSKAQHVGLPQQDEHLDRFGHVRRLAIWIGQRLRRIRDKNGEGQYQRQYGGQGWTGLCLSSRGHESLLNQS